MTITLKDGAKISFDQPISAADAARQISMGLYRSAYAAKINGKVADLRQLIEDDCTLEILTVDDPDGRKALWHTTAHSLAQAVKRL